VSNDPFAGLAAVLGAAPLHVDPHRQTRKGVPEVVFALGKPPHLTLAAVRALLDRQTSGRVLVSRAAPDVIQLLRVELEPAGCGIAVAASGATVVVTRRDASAAPATGGVVGLLTAGASDAPSADEAAWVAATLGIASSPVTG
jgi:NCAIR mutase (PurE)-related protein